MGEMEPQLRRVEQLDSRMWTWRCELEADTRQRLLAMEYQLCQSHGSRAMISARSDQAAMDDIETRLSHLEAVLNELVTTRLPELIAETKNAVVELSLAGEHKHQSNEVSAVSDHSKCVETRALLPMSVFQEDADRGLSPTDSRMAQFTEIVLGSGVRAHAVTAAALGALRDDVEAAAALASEDEETTRIHLQEVRTSMVALGSRLEGLETRLTNDFEPYVESATHSLQMLTAGLERIGDRLDDVEPKVQRCWEDFFTNGHSQANGSIPKKLSGNRTNGYSISGKTG